ncbi:WD40-repeat-containing domain protein [Xylaria telfairii]|nr:WD40-repeat-containing domain protein [Xylaria telfairii]
MIPSANWPSAPDIPNMAAKAPFKTTFAASEVIRPIFTGGDVAIENDARILATTLGDDAILTDIKTGKHLAKVEGDGELISTLTLTPSGSHLIICSRSLSMRIYSLQKTADSIDPQLVRTVRPHTTPVVVLAVDRTSTLLATGGTDGSIKVWDINGGYITHTFRGPSVLVSALLFFELATSSNKPELNGVKGSDKKRRHSKTAHDGETEEDVPATARFRLASGSQDGKVRVWDLHKRSVVANLDSHVSDVRGLDYSSPQNVLVTVSRDKTIRWWDTRSWKPRKVIPCFELVEAVGFIGDGQLTYTAGSNGCLRIWQTETGREVTKEQKEKPEAVAFVAAVYRPGFPFIACIQMDHTIALFKTPVEEATSAIAPPEPFHRISGTHDDIIDLRYLLPDHSIMALATNSEDIRIVSVSEPGDSTTLVSSEYFGQDIALLKGHDDIIITLDVDWSGHWVATGAKDNTAKIWRVDPQNDSYTCWATFQGHAESVSAVALPRIRPVDGSKAHADPLNHPPQFLVTGSSDQTIKRWEIPKEQQQNTKSGIRAAYTRKAHDKDINAIDVSNNAQLFASASQDKVVKIWSIEEGEVQGILRGHRRGVWSVSFAPLNTPILQGEQGSVSGKGVVITGSGDKTIKLWSLTDYTCLRTFEGHSNSVLKVTWLNIPPPEERSKKPMLIASAGGDGLVKVWDVNSGENECTLDNHEDRVWALAVHPDTNMIVSGSGDSTVTFWKDTSTETQTASNEAALKLIEQEQELDNYEYAGAYREAITLALQLNHPRKLQGLFEKVVNSKTPDAGSLSGLKAVDEVLTTLSDEQLFLLLLRLRDWNTNARTAPMAQRILWTVVKSYPVSRLSGLSVKGAKGQKSLKEVLNALKVYTERHYKRMEELVDESYLVEYTLREMDALAPSLDNMKLVDGVDTDVVMT